MGNVMFRGMGSVVDDDGSGSAFLAGEAVAVFFGDFLGGWT